VIAVVAAVMVMPTMPARLSAWTLPRGEGVSFGRSYADEAVPSARGGRPAPAMSSTLLLQPDVVPITSAARYPQLQPSLYQVQDGDTLSTIAERFHLDTKTLVWANEELAKHPDMVKAGQSLVILPLDAAYHTVAEGDTLEGIAAKYQVPAEAILAYKGNDIPDPAHLVVGSKLIVPGAVLPDPKPAVVEPPAPVVAPEDQAYSAPADQVHSGTGQFMWPEVALITQTFGWGHNGIDIAGPWGAPVVAADSGTVVLVAWWEYSYGYHVVIDHGGGLKTLYGHLSEIDVQAGQTVNKGDLIGREGSTGRSTGPHLHFEVTLDGQYVNPFNYLP